MTTLKFKRLTTNAKAPHRATAGASCFDVYVSSINALGGGVTEYCLGIAVEVPEDFTLELKARSSIRERGQVICNGVGEIDSDYRGELKFTTYRVSDTWDYYKIGERCAQIKLVRKEPTELEEVNELSKTSRTGGHGSTGRD